MNEINELKIFLMISLTNFSNLSLMTAEQIVAIHRCGGCKSSPDSNKIDHNNICEAISMTLTFLESLIETLLSASCISAVSKNDLASDSGRLTQIIKLFLMTRLHTLTSAGSAYSCDCKNHIICGRLSKISFCVEEIIMNNKKAID